MRSKCVLVVLFCVQMWAQAVTQQEILSQITGAVLPVAEKSILSFGAKGDGKKDCKPAFDKAMQYAKRQNGLRILVPPGDYLINGPIHLVSHVCIDLAEGAVLRFSDQPEHYLPVVETSWEGAPCWNYSPFIYGKDLEDVAIVGKGTIDGNASATFALWKEKQADDVRLLRDYNHSRVAVSERRFGEGHYLRPHLIQLYGCKRVTIQGLFITRAPFWCVHLL